MRIKDKIKNFLLILSKRKKLLFFLLTLISGISTLWLFHDFQYFLSQGDHGRELYAFEATMEGQAPYKDYWWVYGPLTPYYYSIFFKLFGIDISSILLGKFLLNLVAGIFFFASLSFLISPALVYVATLWFWIWTLKPTFFFTYNHIAGIACLLAVVYFMLNYFRNKNLASLYIALLTTFALSLIKINFGITTLTALILFTYLSDRFHKTPASKRKKYFYLASIIGLPTTVFLVYWNLLKTLPVYAIRQCLPYLASDHPYNTNILTTFKIWWKNISLSINLNWPICIFTGLLALYILQSLGNLYKNKLNGVHKKEFTCAMLLFLSFYFLNMHEYFVSAVTYRTYWAEPFGILLVSLFIGLAIKNSPKRLQIPLILILFAAIFIKFNYETERVRVFRNSSKDLELPRARILTLNSDSWKKTVRQTTAFLKKELSPEENFLALPYDPLYYYLTGKKSPTRQLIFFQHIKIPEEQERKIIQELEYKQINYVLLSNRSDSDELGLGVFGKTYCPLLGKYIFENFTVIKQIGNWNDPPGWISNHGVRILRRK